MLQIQSNNSGLFKHQIFKEKPLLTYAIDGYMIKMFHTHYNEYFKKVIFDWGILEPDLGHQEVISLLTCAFFVLPIKMFNIRRFPMKQSLYAN
jgi:hypothetical protein